MSDYMAQKMDDQIEYAQRTYDEMCEEIDHLTRELAERETQLSSIRQLLEDAEARAGSATASLPDGWVAVPARLTAENGAKGALIGEFYEVSEHECTACDEIDEDETCDVCEGSGIVVEKVAVSWSTIKEIHSRVVALFARPESPPNGFPSKEPSNVE